MEKKKEQKAETKKNFSIFRLEPAPSHFKSPNQVAQHSSSILLSGDQDILEQSVTC